ncbi:MAG: SDR family oxidoreductase [Candidatus Geothermincolia bacterium]
MADRTIFFTGYPGFLGRWLVRDMLANDPNINFTFLVQDKFRQRADEDIAAPTAQDPNRSLKIVTGDVTDPRLGLSDQAYEELAGSTTEVWHLAGAFDLNCPEGVARKVNYWGVRHIVDFCKACTALSHLVHFSSVVVHAEREGLITEDELEAGQDLINVYFRTKFWGEAEVRRAMRDDGLPAVIIRPAGVMGDSRTGETDKFDNVYLTFPLAEVLKRLKIFPPVYLGKGEARPNFIPVDYLTAAATVIGRDPAAIGRCFHIVDPHPPTAREQVDTVYQIALGRRARLSIPTPLVDWSARHMGWAWRLLKIPPDSVTYLNHVGTFDDTNTRAFLAGTGITCPRYEDFMPRLYGWWRENKKRPNMQPKL